MRKLHLVWALLFFCLASAQDKKDTAAAFKFQEELNKEFADKTTSPLTDEDLKTFKALHFYPVTEQFIVTARFTKAQNEKVFEMKTSTTRLPKYIKYGELEFTLEGRVFKLNVYQNIELIKKEGYADYLFLPFSDLTCGKESYIGGRYIDMHIPQSDTEVIDFNMAYNPYCAYNHKYSCPIVPLENDLDIAILAGVKKFHD
ncbi:DUF1684 domain-containing protein [Flavobacterium sp. XGLA_31]|uniref:DUF1684 domain-containing protein n=1 Tax=Flavobacterium sp. XGLA_31 TaxID=3447666 RepID=UPI003F3C29BC